MVSHRVLSNLGYTTYLAFSIISCSLVTCPMSYGPDKYLAELSHGVPFSNLHYYMTSRSKFLVSLLNDGTSFIYCSTWYILKVNDVQGSSAWGCTHSGHMHTLQGGMGLVMPRLVKYPAVASVSSPRVVTCDRTSCFSHQNSKRHSFRTQFAFRLSSKEQQMNLSR